MTETNPYGPPQAPLDPMPVGELPPVDRAWVRRWAWQTGGWSLLGLFLVQNHVPAWWQLLLEGSLLGLVVGGPILGAEFLTRRQARRHREAVRRAAGPES